MQTMNAAESQDYPTEQDNGIGGWPSEDELTTNSDTGQTYWQDVLAYATGVHFLGVDYGGTNAVSGGCASYLSDEETMIGQAVNAGYQPFQRYSMTWGSGFSSGDVDYSEAINQLMHGPEPTSGTYCPASSTYLDMTYPGLLIGPDFWYFAQIGDPSGFTNGVGSGIHPTHPAGENAYRQAYEQAALYEAHAG
jgi:hypothetical protein